MKFILASASIRRQELLARIIENFEIKVSNFNEDEVEFKGDVNKYVQELALGKGKAISSSVGEDDVIISADTVVSFNGSILGKPKDKEDAFKMLSNLSGNIHEVYSGVCIINNKTKEILCKSFKTEVTFSEIEPNLIRKYIDTGSPLDKAGAYGIQDQGGLFVEKINGCYYNVVGLPLNGTYKMIQEIIK